MSCANKTKKIDTKKIKLFIAVLISSWNIKQLHALEGPRRSRVALAAQDRYKTPVYITPIIDLQEWKDKYTSAIADLKINDSYHEILKNITKKLIKKMYNPITILDISARISDPRIEMDAFIDTTERVSVQDYPDIQKQLDKYVTKDPRSIVMDYFIQKQALNDIWVEWTSYKIKLDSSEEASNYHTLLHRFFFITRPNMTIINENTIASDIAITEHSPLKEMGDPLSYRLLKTFSTENQAAANATLLQALIRNTYTSHIIVDKTSTIHCSFLVDTFPFVIASTKDSNSQIYAKYNPLEKLKQQNNLNKKNAF